VERHLGRLLSAADPHAFLVIEVEGTPHFLQFNATASTIELDYPQATVEQRQRAAALGSICSGAGLLLRKTEGSDGTHFLDCDLPRDPPSAAATVRRALQELFGASSSTTLLFSGEGLPTVAA
jgi:hypothetical protein